MLCPGSSCAGEGNRPRHAPRTRPNLDDEVRVNPVPDKLTTQEWLDVARAAHNVGFRTTSTIM